MMEWDKKGREEYRIETKRWFGRPIRWNNKDRSLRQGVDPVVSGLRLILLFSKIFIVNEHSNNESVDVKIRQ